MRLPFHAPGSKVFNINQPDISYVKTTGQLDVSITVSIGKAGIPCRKGDKKSHPFSTGTKGGP
ncbi:MAG: hypothetical protein DRH32_00005, partial [Deltaproteobacteria bacterium]